MKRNILFSYVLLCGMLATICGCGKDKGNLTGEVFLNEEPLNLAQITAYDSENKAVGIAMIHEGKYRLDDLPLGPVILVVQTYLPDGRAINSAGAPPRDSNRGLPPEVTKSMQKDLPEGSQQQVKPVPLKYTDSKRSDLKTAVVVGTTVYHIKMVGKGEIPKGPPIGMGGGPPVPFGGPPPPPPMGPR